MQKGSAAQRTTSADRELLLTKENKVFFEECGEKKAVARLILKNDSDHDILFKVKTTAPLSYCVKPNAGFINSKDCCEVEFTLKSSEKDDDEDYSKRSRDKFMIQSAFAPPEGSLDSMIDFWTRSEQVRNVKLGVQFRGPELDKGDEMRFGDNEMPQTMYEMAQGYVMSSMAAAEAGNKQAPFKKYDNNEAHIMYEEPSFLKGTVTVAQVLAIGIVALFIGLLLGKLL